MNKANPQGLIENLKSYIEKEIAFHEKEWDKARQADNPYAQAIHTAKVDALHGVYHYIDLYINGPLDTL